MKTAKTLFGAPAPLTVNHATTPGNSFGQLRVNNNSRTIMFCILAQSNSLWVVYRMRNNVDLYLMTQALVAKGYKPCCDLSLM